MTLTYSFRPYMLRMLAVFTAIPVIAFLFLLTKVRTQIPDLPQIPSAAVISITLQIVLPLFGAPLVALGCMIWHWNDDYIFTATEVTYVARGKVVWTAPVKGFETTLIRNFRIPYLGLRIGIGKENTSVPMHWITRTTFKDYLCRAGES